jgi:hypothetical protein
MKVPQLIVAVVGLCCSLASASVVVASAAEDSNTVQRRRLFDVASQPEPAAAATITTTHIRGASVDNNLFLAEESDEELVRALGGYGSLVRCSLSFRYPCQYPCSRR